MRAPGFERVLVLVLSLTICDSRKVTQSLQASTHRSLTQEKVSRAG